jgi:hypothetical protein
MKNVGPDFMNYVKAHRDPLDTVFALTKRHQTVLPKGGGGR